MNFIILQSSIQRKYSHYNYIIVIVSVLYYINKSLTAGFAVLVVNHFSPTKACTHTQGCQVIVNLNDILNSVSNSTDDAVDDMHDSICGDLVGVDDPGAVHSHYLYTTSVSV